MNPQKRRTSLRAMALLLTVMMLALPAAAQSAANPEISRLIKVATAGGDGVIFTTDDFTALLPAGIELDGILLISVPAPVDGRLQVGGRILLSGEAVPFEMLDALTFVPSASIGQVQADFRYLPIIGRGVGAAAVSAEIIVVPKTHTPPTVQGFEATTYRNIPIYGALLGKCEDDSPLTYQITAKPARGTVTILDNGTFNYTPYHNKTGSDTFRYIAINSAGQKSAEATVRVRIERPRSNITYADMAGNSAWYAATALAEHGLFVGDRIGGQFFFAPERTLTRGEFLAMAVMAAGLPLDTAATVTGFSDDASTPSWVKPYANSAVEAGIISGIQAGGRLLLSSESTITRAEAAVMIDNLLRLSTLTDIPRLDPDDAVPVWAAGAKHALTEARIMPTRGGRMEADAYLTRAEAAKMLIAMRESLNLNQRRGGLLSWAFDW
jgi:hypothetical protein